MYTATVKLSDSESDHRYLFLLLYESTNNNEQEQTMFILNEANKGFLLT